MTPPTVCDLKWAATQEAIAEEPVPPPKLLALSPDVVVDLALGDHRLELGQGGRRVGPVEAADRQHGVAAGGQLDRRGLLGALGRGDPLVLRRILLEELDQRAAHLGAAGQAAHRDAAAAEAAHARCRRRSRRREHRRCRCRVARSGAAGQPPVPRAGAAGEAAGAAAGAALPAAVPAGAAPVPARCRRPEPPALVPPPPAAPPPGAPPGPPNAPVTVGPALGIEPVYVVFTVSSGVGERPAEPGDERERERRASASSGACAAGRRAGGAAWGRRARPTAPASPASSTVQRSHGSHAGRPVEQLVRPTRPVTRIAISGGGPARPGSRACQSDMAPTPTSAPIAGASATM